MAKPKVFVSVEFWDVGRMFKRRGWDQTFDIANADLVVFTGGADIDPSIYNEQTHPSVYTNKSRDAIEVKHFLQAQELGLPTAGICRGAQLVCAMSGGKLFQDVNNHSSGPHDMIDAKTGDLIETTSIHHQMCILPDGSELIAYATEATTKHTYSNTFTQVDEKFGVDVEVFYIPGTKSFGFQGHPEASDDSSDCQNYFFEKLSEHIGLRGEM